MTAICYNCARTPCDSQCPTGGVYAKAITKASNVNVWTIPTSDTQTWTLAAPERTSVVLSGEEFTKLQAKAARVDALEAELKEWKAKAPVAAYYSTLEQLKEKAMEQASIASTPWIIPYDKDSTAPFKLKYEGANLIKIVNAEGSGTMKIEEAAGKDWQPYPNPLGIQAWIEPGEDRKPLRFDANGLPDEVAMERACQFCFTHGIRPARFSWNGPEDTAFYEWMGSVVYVANSDFVAPFCGKVTDKYGNIQVEVINLGSCKP